METDASRVGLGASLLQTRSGTSFPRDETPDNSILRPSAFVSKESVKCGKKIQQYRKRSTRYTIWTQKFPSLAFCKRGEYHHRSKTASGKIKKRGSNTIIETTLSSTQHTPIQNYDHIQTWTRSIHSRPQGKQR